MQSGIGGRYWGPIEEATYVTVKFRVCTKQHNKQLNTYNIDVIHKSISTNSQDNLVDTFKMFICNSSTSKLSSTYFKNIRD